MKYPKKIYVGIEEDSDGSLLLNAGEFPCDCVASGETGIVGEYKFVGEVKLVNSTAVIPVKKKK